MNKKKINTIHYQQWCIVCQTITVFEEINTIDEDDILTTIIKCRKCSTSVESWQDINN